MERLVKGLTQTEFGQKSSKFWTRKRAKEELWQTEIEDHDLTACHGYLSGKSWSRILAAASHKWALSISFSQKNLRWTWHPPFPEVWNKTYSSGQICPEAVGKSQHLVSAYFLTCSNLHFPIYEGELDPKIPYSTNLKLVGLFTSSLIWCPCCARPFSSEWEPPGAPMLMQETVYKQWVHKELFKESYG